MLVQERNAITPAKGDFGAPGDDAKYRAVAARLSYQ